MTLHKKYHKKYVKSETSMKKSALYDVVSELKELNSDLIALDIPTSARYAFLAAASGMSITGAFSISKILFKIYSMSFR